MSELYNKIAALCAEKGITVTELCRQCEISRASLSDLKVGRKPSTKTFQKLPIT
ncbi:MAG: helix-turn-helix domain-containing protein [Gemmiger sp.]